MKCAGGAGDELLLGSCWLDSKLDPPSPPACQDLIDSLLAPEPISEVKPLPPFTGYTRHLSINGISGYHYHAIAQRLPEENNNYPTQSGYGADHDVVSSSTCAADNEPSDLEDVKPFALDAQDTKELTAESTNSGAADSCAASCSPPTKFFDEPKSEMYDISAIEDIAAIISSAIAVPSQPEDPDKADSRDSWMDIEAWLPLAQNGDKFVPQDLTEFLPSSPPSAPPAHHTSIDFPSKASHEFSKNHEFFQKNLGQATSTLQTLLTHAYMPSSLLQTRLQNGPPVKQEAPSSTSYGMDVISTSSPPGNAVSSTDGVGNLLNGRYQSHYSLNFKPDGLCSPDRLLGYPHAHTTTVTPSSKSKRSRAKAKQAAASASHHSMGFPSAAAAAELNGLLGKEKPVHRCGICNRGFLNKSNIKVHLRTHTGEKPFRCDVCAKAFRQKAHLIKHQQIHKRIGRD